MNTIIVDKNVLNQKYRIGEDTIITGKIILAKDDSLEQKVEIVLPKAKVKCFVDVKVVLYDASRYDGDFVLTVEENAAYTESYLSIKCLVIDNTSTAKVTPSLEIKNNEVKSGHGATVGYVDQEQFSFLQKSGITAKRAKDLLVKAF